MTSKSGCLYHPPILDLATETASMEGCVRKFRSPLNQSIAPCAILASQHQPHESKEPAAASSSDNVRWFADVVYSQDAALKAHLRYSFPTVRDVDDVVQESYVRVWRRQLDKPIASAKVIVWNMPFDRKASTPVPCQAATALPIDPRGEYLKKSMIG